MPMRSFENLLYFSSRSPSLRYANKEYRRMNLVPLIFLNHQIQTSRFYKSYHHSSFLITRFFHRSSTENQNKNGKQLNYNDKNASEFVNNKDKLGSKSSAKETSEDLEENLGLGKKFKLMYKRYWYVLIPVHLVTSIVWYGSFFFAAKSGFDLVSFLETYGASESIVAYIRNSNAGYYGIAYGMYKIATPARYTVTLGGTTIAINYLKERGYIKPVPTKKELQVMYQDKKVELKGKTDEMRGKYQEKKDNILEKYQGKTDEFREKYEEKRKEIIDKLSKKDGNR